MGAWIEICVWASNSSETRESHPTMGAWIEIVFTIVYGALMGLVAPHDGCVD